MADYDRFKFGTVEYPLTGIPDPAKVVCNPSLAAGLNYYTAMLQRYLGPYWDAITPTINMGDYVGRVVGEKVPYDPGMYGVDATRKLPLLCLYRTEERMYERTIAWTRVESTWVLQWILPPCTAAQYLQMSSVMVAARAILVDRTATGYDPTYMSGVNVWLDALGEGFRIRVDTAEYGHWVVEREKTQLRFPVLTLRLQVDEREQATPGLYQFVTFDTMVDVKDQNGSETVVETTQDLT